MSTNDESTSKQSNNEDILKSLRQLNSCITLTSVKDSNAESSPHSPSGSSSEDSLPDLAGDLPPALRGISIQGSKDSGALLSNLLGKKKQEEEKKKEETQSTWLNEWSKRCLSISFSSKPSGRDKGGEEEEDEEEDEGEEEEEEEDEEPPKKKRASLENGTPSSSASNSASNSRDSFSGNKSKLSGNNSISIRPLPDLPKSISFSVVKPQINQSELKTATRVSTSKKPPSEAEREYREKSPDQSSEKEEEDQEKDDEEEDKSDGNTSFEEDVPLQERLKSKQYQDHLSLSSSKDPEEEAKFICSFCSQAFIQHSQLISHIPKCNQAGISVSVSSHKRVSSGPVARKRTISRELLYQEKLCCVRCRLGFPNRRLFEEHHLKHFDRSVEISVNRISDSSYLNFNLEASDSDSRGSNSGSGANNKSSARTTAEDKSLKLTFKISSVRKRGRGQKRKTTVKIVNPHEMSEGFEDAAENGQENSQLTDGAGGDREKRGGEMDSSQQSAEGNMSGEGVDSTTPGTENLPPGNSSFNNYGNDQMNFGPGGPNDRPPSTYQPQFESFPGDWFNEYESGSRIAAAMTGSSEEGNANDPQYNADDPRNNRTSPYVSNANSSEVNKEHPGSTSNDRDGLFSQAVLGGEPTPGADEARQGSFEQLCLNDSYGQNQQDTGMPPPNVDPNYAHSQPYHNQQAQGSNDLLSELAYLNNGQQMDPTRAPPMEGERAFNTHNSNSGTPTSSGHPTPPPTDTSFRALATSPLNSPTSPMNTSGPTPPMQPGISPPMQNSTSPLQQMVQMGSQAQDAISAPRLTIANNLMATTANSGMGSMPGPYGQQWPGSNSQPGFQSNYMQNSSMAGSMGSGIRPQVHAALPIGYRPSPPPRIRGRPPLMGHVGRPPMMRGPGRPPGSTALPPLMAAPGGTRGGMMPSLQRLPQYAGPRQPLMGGQKRGATTSVQSPNKSLRREDINVPARQKDNECQIIAVANRTGDGMPVISNVQGGGSRDERSNRGSPAAPSESTIHLSDSITLSVRSNSGGRDASRTEKGGDAGVVANLLASRGITVAPAAGEKEGAGNGGREERRLPTASDLNLSSAISVHPPTSRDRDGFAVPHPPSAKSSSSSSSSGGGGVAVNNQVDRPSRPPTVDLTQEIPTGGAQATRLQCHQCDRTFPTQALLSDHSKVHQQQAQSRMPFKCHLCTAAFSTQKAQQQHYQQFHQLHLSAGDLAIPVVDFRNPVNVQRMARLGIRSFLPLTNLQNRGASGVVGIPVLTLENLHNGQMNLQQWGITDVLTLGPPRTMNIPR